MSRSTVLVLPGWYPTDREPLLGPFVRDHARAAASRGYDVVVIVDEGQTPGQRRPFKISLKEDEALTVFGFTARRHWAPIVYPLAVMRIARRLAREGRPVAVIHAHVHWMAWPAVMVGSLLNRPVVVSEHSSAWPRRMLSRNQLWRARISFRRAALICPVNEKLRAAIESYGVRARFRVVPNTVDTRIFYPATGRERSAPTRLINVALHVEVKGLDLLLRAFAEVGTDRPDLTLEMIGDGPLTSDLKRLAAELGVADRVRFAGRATPAEIADALRRSDVLVLSSLSENMPLAVLEALCCGLPVVGTDVGGVPDAVGADGALAPSGDVGALARTIDEVLHEYERFDRATIASRAAARYSFDAVGAIWHEIYSSL